MEGRSTAAPVRPVVRSHRTPPWLIAAVGAALLMVLAVWWWWPRDAEPAFEATQPTAPALLADDPAPTPLAGGAMILDEHSGEISAPPPGEAAAPVAPATPAATIVATAAAASVTAQHGALTAAAASPQQRNTAVRSAARPKPRSKEEENLLGTLLGIIKQPQNAPAKSESMDTLIARIRADESRSTQANRAAFDSIGSSASTDSGIQAQLRRCPAANTVKGMACRRNICEKLAGQDPACPAR